MVIKLYIQAIIITSIIFISGLMIGFYLSTTQREIIEKQITLNSMTMNSVDMELKIIENIKSSSVCSYLKNRLPDLARKKTLLANEFNKAPESEREKLIKDFTLSLVRYWLFMKIQAERCHINNPIILFFFDNSDESKEEGAILDHLVYVFEKRNESISVFAFDGMRNESVVNVLKNSYFVNKTPAVIINDTNYGFLDEKNMTNVICKIYNLSSC